MPKIGMFHEADGSISMRRVLAFFFAIAAACIFGVGAFNASMPAVYGGIALVSTVLLLLFFTTWESVAEIIAAWKGKGT